FRLRRLGGCAALSVLSGGNSLPAPCAGAAPASALRAGGVGGLGAARAATGVGGSAGAGGGGGLRAVRIFSGPAAGVAGLGAVGVFTGSAGIGDLAGAAGIGGLGAVGVLHRLLGGRHVRRLTAGASAAPAGGAGRTAASGPGQGGVQQGAAGHPIAAVAVAVEHRQVAGLDFVLVGIEAVIEALQQLVHIRQDHGHAGIIRVGPGHG